jgi:predicted hotdog family 3-hydroxylacyl-ACP dehydratase
MTLAAPLDHAAIAALVPHAGSMCLLERALAWDETALVCSASSHRDPANPLRTPSGLLAPCAIEYAAQAMALHGALLGHASLQPSKPGAQPGKPGFLASARGVRFARLRLDDLAGDLRVEVRRQAGDAQQILYAFSVTHAGDTVAEGRATVVLDTPLPAATTA